MMKAQELFDYVMGLNDWRSPEQRFYAGDPQTEVRSVAVCWYPTVAVLEEAVQQGCNVVICHEDPFHPMNYFRKDLADSLYWRANQRKLAVLAKSNLTLFRAHGTLDVSHIGRCFMEACRLTGPSEVFGGFGYIQKISPMAVGELREYLKCCWKLDRIRYVGDDRTKLTRVAFGVGGMGLFVNKTWVQQAVERGIDALICGETDETAMRYADATGIAWFETGHVLSETPGLKHFVADLQQQLPAIPINYLDCGPGWNIG